MNRWRLSSARCLIASMQRRGRRRAGRDDERDVEREALVVDVGDDVLDRHARVASATRSMRSRRSQPDDVAGKVEMMITSGSCSAAASIVAVYGSGSPSSPMASMPSSRSTARARSMRTCAASKTASS